MSFKNRKRDDHGHVIGNDEVDGQKCQHSSGSSTGFGAGGAKEREKNKYNYREEKSREKEGIAAYQQLLAEEAKNKNDSYKSSLKKAINALDTQDAMKAIQENPDLYKKYREISRKNPNASLGYVLSQLDEPFDDDYEEEFMDRAEKISTDIGEYFNDNQLNQLKKYCDRYEVDFDVAKTELAKRFDSMQKDSGYAAPDAADAALDTLTEDIVMGYNPSNEYDEEMKAAQNENAIKSADDDVLDEQFGKDTPERKLAGAMKQENKYTKDDLGYKRNNKGGFDVIQKDTDERDEEVLSSFNSKEEAKSYIKKMLDKNEPQRSSHYTDNPIGKMTSKEHPELTGERILHEGFKRAIPPEKISNALVKALGVSKEEADAYVKENTISVNDPGWMDFDEWLEKGTPENFAKKTAKMPNGKEMSLFDFAHNIVNYLDTDTAAYIIADKFGVSENDAKAYLESPYNTEGSKEDYERKLKNSRG